MKDELMSDFGIRESTVTVIPFGINNSVPDTHLSGDEARARLGLSRHDKVMLFFGNIAPYKGLDYLIEAFEHLATTSEAHRLLIAGPVKQGSDQYWRLLEQKIGTSTFGRRIQCRIEYIPDEETELYFKASDVLILPYVHIFQSGVLFLAYGFGLPVIASDVGSMKEDIIEGTTGYVCAPRDPASLEKTILEYFDSDLFRELGTRRPEIRDYANKRYSWDVVAETTRKTYRQILGTL
jgi:glycosyltransferase involved in cell wall biosynthesis